MRSTSSWLPHAERIALWFPETPHRCKAVYDDGHLVEYAVFTPDELQVARVNDYRVLLDRRAHWRAHGRHRRARRHPSRSQMAGRDVPLHVLVASQRARRGRSRRPAGCSLTPSASSSNSSAVARTTSTRCAASIITISSKGCASVPRARQRHCWSCTSASAAATSEGSTRCGTECDHPRLADWPGLSRAATCVMLATGPAFCACLLRCLNPLDVAAVTRSRFALETSEQLLLGVGSHRNLGHRSRHAACRIAGTTSGMEGTSVLGSKPWATALRNCINRRSFS